MIKIGIVRVSIKGGPGSGNWGHAGRPGMLGGSGSSTAGKMRLGKTLRRFHMAKLGREETEQKKEEARQTVQETREMFAARQASRAEAIKPVTVEEGAAVTGVVDTVDQIEPGDYGRGYFIRGEDGMLVDITGDFGGGTNDHVGYAVATENPELIGLSKADVAGFVQLENDLFVEERWEWGSPEFEAAEFEYNDRLMAVWENIFDAGNVRVREHGALGGRFGGKYVVAIDGPLSHNQQGMRRLQNYVLDGKLGRADVYVWESSGGDHMSFSYDDLMAAEAIRDLR